MNNEKVLELVDRIEESLRDLAKETGEEHISLFIINGYFHLTSFANDKGQTTLNFTRTGGADNGENI